MKLLIAAALFVLVPAPALAATEAELAAEGRAALERGDFAAAVDRFEKAVALSPRNARAHFQLGSAYGRQALHAGMFSMMSIAPKMKDAFARAIELDPDFLPPRFSLIEYYIQAPAFAGGSSDKALEQATEIRKRDAVEGHRAFARIYALQEKHDLAVKEMTQATVSHPGSARAHYYLGNAYLGGKDWKGALRAYEAALALDPAFMPTYLRIGNHAARSESNYARGEEALRKYLAYKPADTEPGHGGAWYWLGMIQEKQGRKAEARESYLNAQRLIPEMKEIPEALKRVS